MKAVITQEIHRVSLGVQLGHEHIKHFIFSFRRYGNVSFRDCEWEDGMVCGHALLGLFSGICFPRVAPLAPLASLAGRERGSGAREGRKKVEIGWKHDEPRGDRGSVWLDLAGGIG